jgi:DNA-binding MarR family transcriptional regulator
MINFFRFYNRTLTIGFVLSKSLITGLGASGLVPLFLNTISSDLLASSQANNTHYFVIGGFCILSAIFSSKFIDSLGDKIIQDIRQEVKEDIKRVSLKVTEVKDELEDVTTESDFKGSGTRKSEYENLPFNEIEILKSMYENKYTYRSISGISIETNMSKDEITPLLEGMMQKEYIKKYIREDGRIRWRLTEKGREIIAEKFGDEDSY